MSASSFVAQKTLHIGILSLAALCLLILGLTSFLQPIVNPTSDITPIVMLNTSLYLVTALTIGYMGILLVVHRQQTQCSKPSKPMSPKTKKIALLTTALLLGVLAVASLTMAIMVNSSQIELPVSTTMLAKTIVPIAYVGGILSISGALVSLVVGLKIKVPQSPDRPYYNPFHFNDISEDTQGTIYALYALCGIGTLFFGPLSLSLSIDDYDKDAIFFEFGTHTMAWLCLYGLMYATLLIIIGAIKYKADMDPDTKVVVFFEQSTKILFALFFLMLGLILPVLHYALSPTIHLTWTPLAVVITGCWVLGSIFELGLIFFEKSKSEEEAC